MFSESVSCNTDVSAEVAFHLADGFTDYLAARVLFLAGLPKQGAVLGSTAVEKSIKAVLATGGKVITTHVSQKHWDALVGLQPTLAAELQRDFVLLCQRVYMLRYTGDPPAGFNVVVASKEFLAELDETVCRIQLRFQLVQDGKSRQSSFHAAHAKRDTRLWQQNHFLGGIDKTGHIAGQQIVYEARQRQKGGAMFEIQYTSCLAPTQSGFLRAGATVSSDGKTWTLSHAYDGT